MQIRLAAALFALTVAPAALHSQTLTGQAAFTDYSQEHPGVRRHLTVADLPEPKPDESVDNGASIVPKPDNAWPIAPSGFKVELYAGGSANTGNISFQEPRLLRTAPNGDLFLADSHAGEVKVLRGLTPDPTTNHTTCPECGTTLPPRNPAREAGASQ